MPQNILYEKHGQFESYLKWQSSELKTSSWQQMFVDSHE